jgi:hypothetical protein
VLNLVSKECPLISQTDQHHSSRMVFGFGSPASTQPDALAALPRHALLRQKIIRSQ